MTTETITPPVIAASMPQHQKLVDALTAARGNADALEALVNGSKSDNSYAKKARAYGVSLIDEAQRQSAPAALADDKHARKIAQQKARREAARAAKASAE